MVGIKGEAMPSPPFEVIHARQPTSCVVFASPHSGRDYPWSLLRKTVLNELHIRSSEDAFVDQLFDAAPEFGAPFIKARVPRAYVDLNRAADELDPALIEGVSRQAHNPRVASGLGVVPRVVAGGRAIYRGKLPLREAEKRLAQFWQPYHSSLQALLEEARLLHGQAVLVDCHSMPHEAIGGISRGGGKRPNVVLGDRFGAAARPEIVDRIEAAFVDAGFVVARNAPFAGAYVTQAYGRPSKSQHAIQVEIDRSIYMNEAKIEPNARFDEVRLMLRGVIAEIAQIGQDYMPLAAE